MENENEKTLDEIMDMLELQEEILQFTHFTNEDAYTLGNFMVEEARKRDLKIAIRIMLNSGLCLFQYVADGKNLTNQKWLERKHKVVLETETSSLYLYAKLKKTERTMADVFLDEFEYANSGGGFPIRMEDCGVIGSVCVSGMNHVADHDFVVKCLAKYLHTDEIPRIRKM